MGKFIATICVVVIALPVFTKAIASRAIDLNLLLSIFIDTCVEIITQQPQQPPVQPPPAQPEQEPEYQSLPPVDNEGGL